MSGDARAAAALRTLAAAGIAGARVAVAGHDGSIAVIAGVPAARLPELAVLAPRLKAAGFRYVTLDIGELAP